MLAAAPLDVLTLGQVCAHDDGIAAELLNFVRHLLGGARRRRIVHHDLVASAAP